jgi:hypothetical protein
MSIPCSSEELACIRDDARRLAVGAAHHEHELEAFVRTPETDVRHAEAALSQALDGSHVTADDLNRLGRQPSTPDILLAVVQDVARV